ncbi:class I SAM-dependent DNA methyltransferase [Streptomyces sp. NPDC048566]|uniref:class I SAM-dependent DNA methyltransferase n=1 Tax=Streptomyces sp. NPDC048566 TaxID=3365569 RepID=UPI003717ECF3
MTTRLHTTRSSYDTVAGDYAALFSGELARPLEMAVLAEFARRVRAGGGGPVGDLGCGPGRMTVHLEALGLDVFGIDLSPGMIEVARATHPHLSFSVGTMAGLDLADGSLAGALVWYSTVHTPIEELPPLFAEFRRVLAPGGHLLIGFKAGAEPVRRLEHAYGHAVDMDVYSVPPEHVAERVAEAGLVEVARLVREAEMTEYGLERTAQGFVLARKPAAP